MKKRLIRHLQSLPSCYFFVKEAKSIRGIPDIIGCIHGRFFAIELKKSIKELSKPRTKLQAYHIREINLSGGQAFFCYPENYDEIVFKLSEMTL